MNRKVDERKILKNLPVQEKVAQIIAGVLIISGAMTMLIGMIASNFTAWGILLGVAIGPLGAAIIIMLVMLKYQKKRLQEEDAERERLGIPYKPGDPYVPFEQAKAEAERRRAAEAGGEPAAEKPAPVEEPREEPTPVVEPAPAPVKEEPKAEEKPAEPVKEEPVAAPEEPNVQQQEEEPVPAPVPTKEEPTPAKKPAPAPVREEPVEEPKKKFDVLALLGWLIPLVAVVGFFIVEIFEFVYCIEDTLKLVDAIQANQEPPEIYYLSRSGLPLLIALAILIITLVAGIKIAVKRKNVIKACVPLTLIPLLMGLNYVILGVADYLFVKIYYDIISFNTEMVVFGGIAFVVAIVALCANKARFVYEIINIIAFLTLAIFFFMMLGKYGGEMSADDKTHVVWSALVYIFLPLAMFFPRLKKYEE